MYLYSEGFLGELSSRVFEALVELAVTQILRLLAFERRSFFLFVIFGRQNSRLGELMDNG
jgi:hypothetical protein